MVVVVVWGGSGGGGQQWQVVALTTVEVNWAREITFLIGFSDKEVVGFSETRRNCSIGGHGRTRSIKESQA